MERKVKELIDRLEKNHALDTAEYAVLIRERTPETAGYLGPEADALRAPSTEIPSISGD